MAGSVQAWPGGVLIHALAGYGLKKLGESRTLQDGRDETQDGRKMEGRKMEMEREWNVNGT